MRRQLSRMSHVMFGGLTHEPAVRLAGRLVDITPAGLEHVFFTDSGSVSVEVAIKMCLQYWKARGKPKKRRLLTWRGGYHGDTFQAMSVCDPDNGLHSMWGDVLPQQVFADPPPPGFDAGAWRELYGAQPSIASYLFYPQPTTMIATTFVEDGLARDIEAA